MVLEDAAFRIALLSPTNEFDTLMIPTFILIETRLPVAFDVTPLKLAGAHLPILFDIVTRAVAPSTASEVSLPVLLPCDTFSLRMNELLIPVTFAVKDK